jgi:hypothetical protein
MAMMAGMTTQRGVRMATTSAATAGASAAKTAMAMPRTATDLRRRSMVVEPSVARRITDRNVPGVQS